MGEPGSNENLYLYKDVWRIEVVLEGRHLIAMERFYNGWLSWFAPLGMNLAVGRILNAARGSIRDTPSPVTRR